jgi:hypothetical protein
MSVPACSLSLWKLPTAAVIFAFSYSICHGILHSITNCQLFRKPTGLSKLVRLICVSATCKDHSNYSRVIIHVPITVQPTPLSFRTHLQHPAFPSDGQKPHRLNFQAGPRQLLVIKAAANTLGKLCCIYTVHPVVCYTEQEEWQVLVEHNNFLH